MKINEETSNVELLSDYYLTGVSSDNSVDENYALFIYNICKELKELSDTYKGGLEITSVIQIDNRVQIKIEYEDEIIYGGWGDDFDDEEDDWENEIVSSEQEVKKILKKIKINYIVKNKEISATLGNITWNSMYDVTRKYNIEDLVLAKGFYEEGEGRKQDFLEYTDDEINSSLFGGCDIAYSLLNYLKNKITGSYWDAETEDALTIDMFSNKINNIEELELDLDDVEVIESLKEDINELVLSNKEDFVYTGTNNNIIFGFKDRINIENKITKVIIPEGVEGIWEFTFRDCTSLKEVVLPNTLKKIGSSAFKYCNSLEKINIPDGVDVIDSDVFLDCFKLKSIELPDSIEKIQQQAFYNCTSLEKIKLSKNLKSIGDSAFFNCKSLKLIEIPEGVKTISNRAFAVCENLEEITIPNSVTYTSFDTFARCKDLVIITDNEYVRNKFKSDFLVASLTSKDQEFELDDVEITESLNEKIERHETLNPKLWNEDRTLKKEVEEKINLIVDEFLKSLENDNIKFKVKDIKLVGSNCSYNYNDKSDLDIHIVMDTESLDCPDNLYPLIYSAYRSLFNGKFDIDFYGIPVEIYVETDDTVQLNDEEKEEKEN